jgi:hypothetical protein
LIHASTNFRLLAPLGLIFVLGLVVRGEDRKR